MLKLFESFVIFCFWLAAIAAFIFLIHFLFSLPMRRMERARLFLDLIEDTLKRDRSVEEMIISLANSRDRTVGLRFHLLAAYLEGGLKLGEALGKAPRFLPPQMIAMLRTGEKLGDLKKVLPACREILQDRPAAVRSAMHYLIFVVLLFSPVFILVVTMTMVFVIPKFREVAGGMGIQLWPLTQFVFRHTGWLIAFEILITVIVMIATLIYIGGPGFIRWFQFRGLPIVDSIASGCGFRGNKNGCKEHFPPCSPYYSMAVFRRLKPSGSPVIARPMKSVVNDRVASSPRLNRERNLMTQSVRSIQAENSIGGSPMQTLLAVDL